jgi:uncharacterized membrane protein YecN with MAPEG domain
MPLPITSIYAALFALFFVVLSFRVIGARRAGRVAIGDGGNRELLRRLRTHANFAEYVPMTIVLMALMELSGSPAWQLHLVGGLLAAGRFLHAVGFGREPEIMVLRVAGMVLTLSALILTALANLGLGSVVSHVLA